MAAYLAIRSADPGPLFIFQDSTPLSRERLVKASLVSFAPMQHRPNSIQQSQLLHWCGYCGGSVWNPGGDNKDARKMAELCMHPLYPDTYIRTSRNLPVYSSCHIVQHLKLTTTTHHTHTHPSLIFIIHHTTTEFAQFHFVWVLFCNVDVCVHVSVCL